MSQEKLMKLSGAHRALTENVAVLEADPDFFSPAKGTDKYRLIDMLSSRWRHAFEYMLLPVVVLTAWSVACAYEWLPANILPAPTTVVDSFYYVVASGELFEHLGISLWRIVQGILLGVSLGLTLGIALGTSSLFRSWFEPSFRVLVQIPSIATIPLLMMVLGIEEGLKIFIMTKACVVPLALLTCEGIRQIPTRYIEVAEVMRLSRRTLYFSVVLPGAAPTIASGIRQGVAHVWVALVAVEVMASAEGIGYLIMWSRQIFQIDVVLVCILVIGLIGFLLDAGLGALEARTGKWR